MSFLTAYRYIKIVITLALFTGMCIQPVSAENYRQKAGSATVSKNAAGFKKLELEKAAPAKKTNTAPSKAIKKSPIEIADIDTNCRILVGRCDDIVKT